AFVGIPVLPEVHRACESLTDFQNQRIRPHRFVISASVGPTASSPRASGTIRRTVSVLVQTLPNRVFRSHSLFEWPLENADHRACRAYRRVQLSYGMSRNSVGE